MTMHFNRIILAAALRVDCRSKGGGGAIVGSYCSNSGEKWCDLGQGGSNESGYILKLEPTGLDDRLDVRSERKRGV